MNYSMNAMVGSLQCERNNVKQTTSGKKQSTEISFEAVLDSNTAQNKTNKCEPVESSKKEVEDSKTSLSENEKEVDVQEEKAIKKEETIVEKEEEPSKEEMDLKKIEELLSLYLASNKLQEIVGLDKEQFELNFSEGKIECTDVLDQGKVQEFLLDQFGAETVADALVNEPLANAMGEWNTFLEEELKEQLANWQDSEQLPEEIQKELELISKNEKIGQEDMLESNENEMDLLLKKEETNGERLQHVKEEESNVTIEIQSFSDSKLNKDNKDSLFSQKENSNESNQKVRLDSVQSTIMEQIVTQTEEAFSKVENKVDSMEIVQQLVERIRIGISQENTSLELQLNPNHLGKVQVQLTQKEGVLSAQIQVESQQVKEAMEATLQVLKDSFMEQGLKVEEVEVTIGNYSNQESQSQESREEQQQQQTKKFVWFDELEKEEVSYVSTQETYTKGLNQQGSVDYIA